jgi:hypothetical protein
MIPTNDHFSYYFFFLPFFTRLDLNLRTANPTHWLPLEPKLKVSPTFPLPYINRPFLSPFINLDLYLLCNFSVHIKHFGTQKSAKYKVITNGLHQSARESIHIHVKQIKTSFSLFNKLQLLIK